MRIYIGTYTKKGGVGIYLSDCNAVTGALSAPMPAAETENPSFLAMHPGGKYLYAVNENDAGQVSSFAIDAGSGNLKFLNREATAGSAPCHISIDPTGRCALVANYGSGNVAAFGIGADGRLRPASSIQQHWGHGPDKARQEGPHAHCISLDPGGRFAFSCDLGLDQVLVYQLDVGAASLRANTPPFASVPPGEGPRHIAFHSTLPFAYVITEMGNTICSFQYNASVGTLTPIQCISSLPVDFGGKSHGAEVAIAPNGRFLYASNRGDDSMVVFAIDPQSGQLTFLSRHPCGGKNPRHFTLDPTGQFLLVANQDTNNIVPFKIDPASGSLAHAGRPIDVTAPVCVIFDG